MALSLLSCQALISYSSHSSHLFNTHSEAQRASQTLHLWPPDFYKGGYNRAAAFTASMAPKSCSGSEGASQTRGNALFVYPRCARHSLSESSILHSSPGGEAGVSPLFPGGGGEARRVEHQVHSCSCERLSLHLSGQQPESQAVLLRAEGDPRLPVRPHS